MHSFGQITFSALLKIIKDVGNPHLKIWQKCEPVLNIEFSATLNFDGRKFKADYIMDILEKIRKLRLERNWTEYQLAEKSGLPQSTISSWYRKNLQPSISSLEKMCDAFNMTLSQFFTDAPTVQLTERQQELLHEINRLSKKQQEKLLQFLKSF